jgi:hypothetical protein
LTAFLFLAPSSSAQLAAPDAEPAGSVSDTLIGATAVDTTRLPSPVTAEPFVETAGADTVQSPSTDSPAAHKETAGVDTTQHARREIPAIPLSEAQVKLVTACENYVQLFPKADQTSQILDIEADVYFKVRDYAKVASICQRILEEFPKSSFREKSGYDRTGQGAGSDRSRDGRPGIRTDRQKTSGS